MAEKNAEVPTNRCGFELQSDDIGFSGSDQAWEKWTSPVCCWRPIWESHDETNWCIWHADVDEKPLAELIAARADSPERLDGAILRHLHIQGEALSLGDCTLHGARFDNSKLQETDFTNTDLIGATFTDADITETAFTDAFLPWVAFIDANLRFTDFTDAFLRGTDFTNADLQYAYFTDALLREAVFTNANLQDAELSDADARYASFRHATLQNAVFTRADCRGVTFTSALLYETVFADTRINSTTTFFDPPTTFYDSITSRPGCVYEENSLTTDQLPDDMQPLEAARWVYRRLETLHEKNALSEEARQFHISKEEAERALYRKQGKFRRWGVKTLMGYLTKHGESVQRVLTWWLGVIFAAGILFSISGGVTDSNGTHYAITSLGELETIAGWQALLMNVYFSVTTFSTIMDGGLAPAGTGTRAIVAIESVMGALFVALLVFVLGRRTAR